MSTMTISLPGTIAKRVDEETEKHGFATRSEFIRALLRRYFNGDLTLESYRKQPLTDVRRDLEKTGKYSDTFINRVIKGLSQSSLYEDSTREI